MTTISYNAERNTLVLRFAFDRGRVEQAKRLYGAAWNKTDRCWEYPPTPEVARSIVDGFDPDCGEGFAEWWQEATALARKATHLRGMLDGKVEAVGDLGLHYSTDPFAHQIEYCEWAAARDLAGLTFRGQFSQQGTGKTKAEIDMTVWEMERGICTGAPLIFCPNSVKPVWKAEIYTHAPPGIFEPVIVRGKAEEKMEQLETLGRYAEAGVIPAVIINYDVLAQPTQIEVRNKLVALARDGFFGKVIFDEATMIKNTKNNRSKTAFIIAKHCPIRVCMTGTPYGSNQLLDVFGVMRVLDESILGASFPAFRKHYVVLGGWQNKQVIGFQREEDLKEKVNRHSYRKLLEECGDMPEEVTLTRTCDLTPAQVEVTQSLKSRMLAELETEDGAPWVLSATEAMTQLLRFNQIASGFIKRDDGTLARFTPNPKLDLLVEILRDEVPEGEKAVVWCAFQADVEQVAKELRKRKIGCVTYYGPDDDLQRERNETQFKTDDDVRVMIATPDAGGFGLNWQCACHCIFYSYGFKWTDLDQAKARIRRLTQRNRMTYTWLVAENPMQRQRSHGATTGICQYILENLGETSRVAAFMTGDLAKKGLDAPTLMRQALEVM